MWSRRKRVVQYLVILPLQGAGIGAIAGLALYWSSTTIFEVAQRPAMIVCTLAALVVTVGALVSGIQTFLAFQKVDRLAAEKTEQDQS